MYSIYLFVIKEINIAVNRVTETPPARDYFHLGAIQVLRMQDIIYPTRILVRITC
jgi:hypothetical protein